MADIIDGNGSTVDVLDANTSSVDLLIDGNDSPPQPYPIGNPGYVSPVVDQRQVTIESLDGSVVIPLNVGVEEILIGGATGLQLPPLDVVTGTTPGMPGSWLQEQNVLEREVFLPLAFASEESQLDFFARMARLRGVLWTNDELDVNDVGTFRLVFTSSESERILNVTYRSGFEGTWGAGSSGSTWEKIPLTLVAVDPFFRNRNASVLPITVTDGEVFLSDDDANGWPRAISPSITVGNNMVIDVDGEVPVWPVIRVQGPGSVASVVYPGTNVQIPTGVIDGQELVLVTDPRSRSARLNGAIAWSKITLGSTMAPLLPGRNTVNIVVGTTGPNSGLVIEWTPGYLVAFG